jgi:lipopolysaccharide/colanic/teichoic acid biosynthesis glycosyltransferase
MSSAGQSAFRQLWGEDVVTDLAGRAADSARIELRRESAKRTLDVAICLMAIIVFGPLLLLLCCLVRWTSPGPALFRQERLGRDRRPFTMLKLDELPQLLNVLKGEMSLVGPRPVLPWEGTMIREQYEQRFIVKPGITGLWQIRGRSRLSMREGFELDIEYARTRCLALDINILVGTLPALFRGGAS